jgi:uncharacterized protein (TIGR03083 family)
MQLTPRYGNDPLIVMDGPPSAVYEPTARQRRRLLAAVSAFTDEQWAHPSRCQGWTNRDVIAHLDTVDTFWKFSIDAGLSGEPTQFLATFDPVASPAQFVDSTRDLPAEQILEKFAASSETFLDRLASLDDDGWRALAEAPPGHQSVTAVAHHALWDAWIHERDILLPLGTTPEQHADEIEASLKYVAALSPAFVLNSGGSERGTLVVEGSDPDIALTVEVGDSVLVRDGSAADPDLRLTGESIELLEALSIRRPLDQPVPPEATWLVSGLAEVFDAGVA